MRNFAIGIGMVLAVVISWTAGHPHSILWAIIHGALGWIYVIFYLLTDYSHLI
jgi:hypothetical protein